MSNATSDKEPSVGDLVDRLEKTEKRLDEVGAHLARRVRYDQGFGRLGLLIGFMVVLIRLAWADFGSGGPSEIEFAIAIALGFLAWLLVYMLGWAIEGFFPDPPRWRRWS